MKKRGISLVEVLISMALMTILLIPATQIVLSVNKTNRTSQIKKESTDIGQGVLERINDIKEVKTTGTGNLSVNFEEYQKNLDIIESATNMVKYKTTEKNKKNQEYDLIVEKQIVDGVSHYTYNIPFADYKKNYQVEIIPKLQTEYKNKDDSKEYKKVQSYKPSINTTTDEVSNECKNSYDFIVKLTNDYSLLYEEKGADDNYFEVTKKYDKTNSFVLKLDNISGKVVAKIFRNKGTNTKVNLEYPEIYSKEICSMDELEEKYKDKVKILFYLCNKDSEGEDKPYSLSQSIIIQSNIDTKAAGEYSDYASIDIVSGDNSTGYLDTLFDDTSYTHDVNYYAPANKENRVGNLYSVTVSVLLDGDVKFKGQTTAIISD